VPRGAPCQQAVADGVPRAGGVEAADVRARDIAVTVMQLSECAALPWVDQAGVVF